MEALESLVQSSKHSRACPEQQTLSQDFQAPGSTTLRPEILRRLQTLEVQAVKQLIRQAGRTVGRFQQTVFHQKQQCFHEMFWV